MKIEYILIKKSDDFYNSINQFKSMLQANSRLLLNGETITLGNYNYYFTLSTQEVSWGKRTERFFNLCISTVGNAEKDAASIEEFDRLIRRIIKECGTQFEINTIWDDASIYYANKLYPKIIVIENLLRKIIYRFMVSIAGSAWFNDTVPVDVKKSIAEVQKKEKVDSEKKNTSDPLYDADFIQLDRFFFNAYPLKPISVETITKLKQLVSTDADKNELLNFLSNYEYKSNWDRYFADIIKVKSFSEKWSRLYQLRNKVAHTKRLKKKEYEEADKIIRVLEKAFNSCLENINSINVSDEEAIAATESIRESVGSIDSDDTPIRSLAAAYKGSSLINAEVLQTLNRNNISIDEKAIGAAWLAAQRNLGKLDVPITVLNTILSKDVPEND